jgi:hypothetical protein
MEKAFVVMQKGYEYDDNIYCEINGGHPKVILFTKEEADLRVRELNIKEYQEVSIRDFTYDDEWLNVDYNDFNDFNKSLIEKYGKIPTSNHWEDTEDKLHISANESEINEYCKMVNISFYDVVEIDIDVSSYRDKKLRDILD